MAKRKSIKRKIKNDWDKEFKERENKLYSNPPIPFSSKEEVILVYKGREVPAIIQRVNSRNYTVEDNGYFFRIDKISLSGYPRELYTEAFNIGSRKWIGENASIKKKD